MYLLIRMKEPVHRHKFGQDDTNRGHQRRLWRIGMANPTTKSLWRAAISTNIACTQRFTDGGATRASPRRPDDLASAWHSSPTRSARAVAAKSSALGKAWPAVEAHHGDAQFPATSTTDVEASLSAVAALRGDQRPMQQRTGASTRHWPVAWWCCAAL
jgi:hypothetical protein